MRLKMLFSFLDLQVTERVGNPRNGMTSVKNHRGHILLTLQADLVTTHGTFVLTVPH